MADKSRLPHDRGHLLWSSEDGATRMLQASMDRWTQAILGDDGIDMPFMGSRDNSSARIIAKSEGIICGTSVVDYLLQIWAPDIRVKWRASDGKSVVSGDEIAELSGPAEYFDPQTGNALGGSDFSWTASIYLELRKEN